MYSNELKGTVSNFLLVVSAIKQGGRRTRSITESVNVLPHIDHQGKTIKTLVGALGGGGLSARALILENRNN